MEEALIYLVVYMMIVLVTAVDLATNIMGNAVG